MKNLLPGLYKIRKQDYVTPYGAKHVRLSNRNHPVRLLRVTGAGEKLRYYIDHDTVGVHPNDLMEDYEVIGKYEPYPQVGNCLITLSFADSSGEHFEFTVRDAWTLRGIFDSMPWLKKPFGYLPRKK